MTASVLLVNPRVCAPSSTRLPLSVLSLAAVLEGRFPWRIVDGNLDRDPIKTALAALAERPHQLAAISVMTGPQVVSAVEMSRAIRAAHPSLPIVWGGYFPSLYTSAAINAPYVDYLVRGQGERAILALLARLPDGSALSDVPRLSWKRDGEVVHNPEAPDISPNELPPLPYERLPSVRDYLRPSFLGSRTAVYQGALGCRFKCDFCGVVSMWNGKTLLEAPERLRVAMTMLRDRWGADAIQFYDNNFFDHEDTSVPILDVLGDLQMPWWCFARTDTLSRFSASTWEKIKKSRLRMAFFGAEAASDEVLNRMRKGARAHHTLEVAARCKEYGVIPEFSFILGGPMLDGEEPEGQIEETFRFVRRIKTINPASEIILNVYSPTPQRDRKAARKEPGVAHLPVIGSYGQGGPTLPSTPDEWAEDRWVRWVCQKDAPWLTERLRTRIKDFARVLACRFPTAQDYTTPPWAKSVLRNLARWRYASGRYDHAYELKAAQRLIRLRDPHTQSL